MTIFIRTVPNVMRHFGCTADDAARFIDLREEGYSTHQAALMAGLSDPPEQSLRQVAPTPGASTVNPSRQESRPDDTQPAGSLPALQSKEKQ